MTIHAFILRPGQPPEHVLRDFSAIASAYEVIGCDCLDFAAVDGPALDSFLREQKLDPGVFRTSDRDRHVRLIVDDDGYRKGLPINTYASALYNGKHGFSMIVGTAILTTVT